MGTINFGGLFSIIWVVFVVIMVLSGFTGKHKKNSSEEEKRTSARPSQNSARTAAGSQAGAAAGYNRATFRSQSSAAARPTGSVQYTASSPNRSSSSYGVQFDARHYHQEGYDFDTCFSFKDVPQGEDELSALIRANSRHERELEHLLRIRE